MIRWHAVLLGAGLLLASAALAQEMDVQVELLAPLGTEISRKGDSVMARVVTPASLKGDMLQGKVVEARSGGKIHGRSVLNFTFETLEHGGKSVPVSTQIKSVANSKGQMNVDEEGRVIRKESNIAKAAGGTAIGGVIGGIAGGRRGALIGSGVGAAASLILIQVAAEGPSIRFAAGSRINLSAKSRSGPALASLSASPAPAAAPEPVRAAAAPEPAPVAAPAAASAPAEQPQQAAAAAAQPDLTAIKADFIPGEKTLFFDDFTDMAGDEPPPHWKVRGGSVELRVGGGVRQLTTTAPRLRLTPNITTFPQNFTLETEHKYENLGVLTWAWNLHEKDWTGPTGASAALHVHIYARDNGVWAMVRVRVGRNNTEEVGRGDIKADLSQPVKQAIWIQNGRLRVYLNGQRVVDVNQVKLNDITGAELDVEALGKPGMGVGLRMVRFAESTPDFSQIIASTGRYVTHGIHFDTDSDRLKPESAAVIRSIAAGLEKNPNLKLKIEGHTDSTGAADHNLDLSKRRAEAVKAVLVSQFTVDAARLATDGLGSGKPMESNDTPQGRAQNRRVEFVRQ